MPTSYGRIGQFSPFFAWGTWQNTVYLEYDKQKKGKKEQKAKKTAAPKKKVAAKKEKAEVKKVEVEQVETKPKEVKAGGICYVPYKPRKIDRLPPPK